MRHQTPSGSLRGLAPGEVNWSPVHPAWGLRAKQGLPVCLSKQGLSETKHAHQPTESAGTGEVITSPVYPLLTVTLKMIKPVPVGGGKLAIVPEGECK